MAGASAKCDGNCAGEKTLLKCWKGELTGGCATSEKCDRFCNVTVKSKAECRQPKVRIAATPLTGPLAQLTVALEANLPILYTLQQRADGIFKATLNLSLDVRELTDIKQECLPTVVATTDNGLAQLTAGITAVAQILSQAEKFQE